MNYEKHLMIQLKIKMEHKRQNARPPVVSRKQNRSSPLFCSGIDVGGGEVCTSAKINVINRIFIHILVIPLRTLCEDCGRLIVEQLSIDIDILCIMSRSHLLH